MIERQKNAYITPLLTVVEFRTERGYAESGFVLNPNNAPQAINDYIQFHESQILVAEQEGHGEVIASEFGVNQDQTSGGSNWQYSNGSWF